MLATCRQHERENRASNAGNATLSSPRRATAPPCAWGAGTACAQTAQGRGRWERGHNQTEVFITGSGGCQFKRASANAISLPEPAAASPAHW